MDENKTVHFYTPDFWSHKLNKYFEIKGYLRERDSIKMQKVIEQNPNILIEMVRKNELNKYLKLFNIDENVK